MSYSPISVMNSMQEQCAYLNRAELQEFAKLGIDEKFAAKKAQNLLTLGERIIRILRDSGFTDVPESSTYTNAKEMRDWMDSEQFQCVTGCITWLDLSDMTDQEVPIEINKLPHLKTYKLKGS